MIGDSSRRLNTYLNSLVVVLAFSIPLYRKWVVVAAPLIMILWLAEGRLREKVATLRTHRLTLAILAFIAFNLLSLVWSADPVEGFEYLAKYRYLLLIPVLASSVRVSHRNAIVTAFLAGVSVSLVLSFAIFAGLFRMRDAYPGNPAPTMSHLDYSMVLAVAALLVLDQLLRSGSRSWQRRASLAMLLLFVTGGLLINIGRSGQLAAMVAAAVVVPLALGRRSRRAAILGVLAVLLTIALAYVLVVPFRDRVDSAMSELGQAVTQQRYDTNQGKRIAGFVVALDMIKQRPVLGTGVGDNMNQFRELLVSRHSEIRRFVYWFPHLHNQYVQVTTEVGLLGLLLLLNVFVQLFRGPYDRDDDRNLAVILGGIYLVGFLGDPYLHKQLPVVLFATLAGLASARRHGVFRSDGS